MEYLLIQNEQAYFFSTFEEALSSVSSPDAEIWKRIEDTENYLKVWP